MNGKLAAVLQPISTLIVVGGNWGDEGKGKVIDLIMSQYNVTVRFSGGANAGHTVFTPEGKKLVSHLIPCGLAQHKTCVMARGEFFNLKLFFEELLEAKKVLGGELPEIFVDRQSALWTPYHSLFEAYIEVARGEIKVGTTNKGIGPLEGLYKLRLAPLVGHLAEPNLLLDVLRALYKVLSPCFASPEFAELNLEVPKPEVACEELLQFATKIQPLATDTSFLLHQKLKSGSRILFEGAQATGLDAWWGTYPYVSSGNSVAAGASIGTGLAMQHFQATMLVVKTLPTRVGFGPFVSEMWERQAAMDFCKQNIELFIDKAKRADFLARMLEKINSGSASNAEMAQYFQVLGDERGATTGRGRSLGFLDIPWLQYVCRINSPKWIALTRFDMLSGVKSIPVVVGYKYQGSLLQPGELPPPWDFKNIEPVFETWDCWPEDIMGTADKSKLPTAAKNFLSKLEKLISVPILLVGTGPGREAMVIRDGDVNGPFNSVAELKAHLSK